MAEWVKIATIITAATSIIMAAAALVQTYYMSQQQKIVIKEIDELKTNVAEINKLMNVSEIKAPQCPEGYRSVGVYTGEGLRYICIPINQSQNSTNSP